MKKDYVFIAIIMISAILVIIIVLSLFLYLAIKKNRTLVAKLQVLSNEKMRLETVTIFLRQLGCDISSLSLSTEVINKLSLESIRLYYRNILMYNTSRIEAYSGLIIGRNLLNYLEDIKDEEKKNYFSSVLEAALMKQTATRLINLFVDDLKDEIINKEYSNAYLFLKRTTFRDWFLDSMIKEENFKKTGRVVLIRISEIISTPDPKMITSQEQKNHLRFWLDKVNSALTTVEKDIKKVHLLSLKQESFNHEKTC